MLWLLCPVCLDMFLPDKYPRECVCRSGAVLSGGTVKVWGDMVALDIDTLSMKKAIRGAMCGGVESEIESVARILPEYPGSESVEYTIPF